MGIVIDVPEAGVDYVLYGDKSNIITNYLQQQMQQIPVVFNEFTERIQNNIVNSYNFLMDKATQYGIKQTIQQQGVNLADNYYQSLTSFDDLQNANLTMQRWVMTHPEVKKLYNQQNIDGYSDSFVNITGNSVGEDDYNYRRVMDGVLYDKDDSWCFKTYLEDLYIGDRELDHFEKDIIINTWDAIDWFLDTCKFDFTNISEEPSKINK